MSDPPDLAFPDAISIPSHPRSVPHSPAEMSPLPILLTLLLALGTGWAQQPPLYTYLGEPYCTHGNSLINGRCWPSRSYRPYPRPRPELDRPRPEWDKPRDPYEAQNLIEPTAEAGCPEGYKKSRGQCSKMTEREIELDRLPKEPCPEGQRKSRLVCRAYPNE